ncbi:hypothetical protein MWU53_14435 [Aliiroseovarius sp. S1123]|uniref:hypothetical protein n=1 Tax=unclassified Aliiroseovarius TaxID=2623558 RepID=UPI001FF13810|nr:hypothetical protein [Aliiroseovarius sp. S1123]MCK0172257.1 hypothetical protein [Aliiroseovarius sp. S1123]
MARTLVRAILIQAFVMKTRHQALLNEAIGLELSAFSIEVHEHPIGSGNISDELMSLAFKSPTSSVSTLVRGNSSADQLTIEKETQTAVDMAEYGRTLILPISDHEATRTAVVRDVTIRKTQHSEEIRLGLSNGSELHLTYEGDCLRMNLPTPRVNKGIA